mgnify:CR=1 FL=1
MDTGSNSVFPPFDTVTEDLWSIIIFYIDSRFLFTIFPRVLIYFIDISKYQFFVPIGLYLKLRSSIFLGDYVILY